MNQDIYLMSCKCFLLWVIVIFVSFTAIVKSDCSLSCDDYDCPCECYKNEVQCSNQNMTEILKLPGHMNIHVLDLDNNFITEIKLRDFKQKSIRSIYGLRLSSNKIKRIKAQTFDGLSRLETLFLNHNYIGDISEDAFIGLGNLRRLYLNDNQMKLFNARVFEPLKSGLKLLYLQGNKIHHIPPDLFKGFQQLTTIDISRNKITKMDGRFFTELPSLQHVFLQNNPWSCDTGTVCSTIGVTETMEKNHPLVNFSSRIRYAHHRVKKPLTFYGGMMCASPIQYMGLMADSLLKTFKCHQVDLTKYFFRVTISDERKQLVAETNEENDENEENSGNKSRLSYYLIIPIIFIRMVPIILSTQ